jgi:hypothetical protein
MELSVLDLSELTTIKTRFSIGPMWVMYVCWVIQCSISEMFTYVQSLLGLFLACKKNDFFTHRIQLVSVRLENMLKRLDFPVGT